MREKIRYTMIFTVTMLAPVGVENTKEQRIPEKTQKTEMIAEETTTLLKLLQRRIAVSAGKIIKLEMSKEPIIRMPSTMVIAVKNANSILYHSALVPVAFAKFSSKVTAKIL